MIEENPYAPPQEDIADIDVGRYRNSTEGDGS